MGYVVCGKGISGNRGYRMISRGFEEKFVKATEKAVDIFGSVEAALEEGCKRMGYDPKEFDFSKITKDESSGHYSAPLKK